MKEMIFSYPDDLALAINVRPEDLPDHLRLMAAMKIFELGQISAGKAAELAGMSKVEFLERCGRNRISPFNYADEEVEAELLADLKVVRGEV